jgi:hypothetical protein
MQWVSPTQKDFATDALEKRLWDAAEQAGPSTSSRLKSLEYSGGHIASTCREGGEP